MTTTMFRELLRQQPFRPFRMVMSNGEAYEVRHPEMVWVPHNDLSCGVAWPTPRRCRPFCASQFVLIVG